MTDSSYDRADTEEDSSYAEITPHSVECMITRRQRELQSAQVSRQPYLIYEDNALKKLWAFYILLICFVIAVMVPYELAVKDPNRVVSDDFSLFMLLVEVSFTIDIVVTFFSTYYD